MSAPPLGRFALEAREVTIADMRYAAEAFDILPDEPDQAIGQLNYLCAVGGVS